ncbi:MAG: hypothetical protein WCA46_00205 [Actinocatenispora sp.]
MSDQTALQLEKSGYRAFEAEDWERAGRQLAEAAERTESRPAAAELWYDAALAYKFLHDWPKAYELGLRAAALSERGAENPVFWNLGIAATILRDWDVARDAWRGYGIPVPDGTGEIVDQFGMTCLRIATTTGQEVVWARRLCPTRARVMSVPFDVSRRYGEVVVHDGAPNGERVNDGRTYPVFDELQLFTPSDLATLSVSVVARREEDARALLDAVSAAGFGAETLGSAQMLCRCCSEGSQTVRRSDQAGRQTVLLGAPETDARRLLDAWRAESPADREWEHLHVAG